MCNFWSAVLFEDGTVFYDHHTNNHSALLEMVGASDDTLRGRKHVKIEIRPTYRNELSRRRGDWLYVVDEPGTLPEWYANDTRRLEGVVWTAWEKAMSESLWKLDKDIVRKVQAEMLGIRWLDAHDPPDEDWTLFSGELDNARRNAMLASRLEGLDEDTLDSIRMAALETIQRRIGTGSNAVIDEVKRWYTQLIGMPFDAQRYAYTYALVMVAADTGGMDPAAVEAVQKMMDVWRKGYGLVRVKDGKWFVYGPSQGPTA